MWPRFKQSARKRAAHGWGQFRPTWNVPGLGGASSSRPSGATWSRHNQFRDANPPRPNVVILNPPTAWRSLRGRVQTLTVFLGYCCTTAVHGQEAFEKQSGRRDLNPRPLDPQILASSARPAHAQVSKHSVVRRGSPWCAGMRARCCTRALYSQMSVVARLLRCRDQHVTACDSFHLTPRGPRSSAPPPGADRPVLAGGLAG